jgi:flavin-dependent dehydrogenase
VSNNHRVCIVGGGPAGLAAAIVLARANYEVMVVDCAVPPVDKACGEGLMPDSIAALAALGIEIPGGIGFPFRGIRFADSRSSVFADFPNGMARGVRRTVLHDLLIQHANRLGISILWGAKHVRLTEGGVSVNGCFLAMHLVVGADGQKSSIRREAGLDVIRHERRRYGFRRHYRVSPWSCYMELHWGARSQIYITPVATDEICIAVISRDPKLRLEQALHEFPELQTRLKDAEPVSPEMGALSVTRHLRRVQRNGVVLTGDASGAVDAITGEGLCLGFKQALALEKALRSEDIEQYQRFHDALMDRPRAMSSLLLTLDGHLHFQRRTLAGLAAAPEIFKALLAIHVGDLPFGEFRPRRLLRFSKGFLAA